MNYRTSVKEHEEDEDEATTDDSKRKAFDRLLTDLRFKRDRITAFSSEGSIEVFPKKISTLLLIDLESMHRNKSSPSCSQ